MSITLCSNSQTFNPYLAAKLDSTLIAFVPKQVKGVSASVYVPGQGIWRGTYGVSYAGHPITKDMEFGIASNTKLFVASTIMKLVEANKLNLNDHLGKWVKTKYTNIDSTISVKQLLNHTSGLADNSLEFIDSVKKYPNKVFTITEILSYQDPKKYSPGGGFNYSNTNYMLLGMIAESVTGFHISKLIRDSLLTPRNLDSIFYAYKESVVGTIAHPWVSGVDDTTTRIGLNSASGACGAMYSTAADMVKWYNALFTGQVVNANSLAQMTTFTGVGNYGFALEKKLLLGRVVWGHGGKTIGYLSQTLYDPITKATAFGISNSDSASVDGTTFILLKTIADNLPDTATAITGSQIVCQGQNAVTYTVPAIAKATSYTWTLPNGATGSSTTNSITVSFANNATSGNILVSGTNLYGNGNATSLAITVKPAPNTTIIPNGATTFCSGNTVMLTVSGGTNYLWNTAATTPSINVATTGNYFVTIIGANDCSATSVPTSVTVVQNATPSVIITASSRDSICAGANIVFTATLANGGNAPQFQWKKNGNNVGSNSNTYADNGLANKDSVWCVLTSNSSCVVSTTAISNKIKFTVSSLPASPAAITGNLLGCTIGDINNLTDATIGGVWNSSNISVATINNIGKITAVANGTSTISYTVTNASGCSSFATANFTVAVPIVAAITGVANICKGANTILLCATPNGVWSSLNNAATIAANTGIVFAANAGMGSIKYTVTNANGCKAFSNYAFVVNPIPNVPSINYAPGTVNPQMGAASAFCNGKTFTLVGTPNGGIWGATGGIVVNANSGVVNTVAVGNASITYTYTSALGCSNSRTIAGVVAPCAARGTNNEQLTIDNRQFTIYPNPVRSFISLNVKTLVGAGSIVITNLYGKQVKTQTLSMGNNTIDVSNFAKGMYFVSMITDAGKQTQKIIVE